MLVKLAKDGGAKTLAMVHQDSSYGKDVSAAVASAAKGAGLETTSTSAFKPGEAQQAAAAARKAAPDAVVLIARDDAQGAIAELNNAGLSGKQAHPERRRLRAVWFGPGVQGAGRRPCGSAGVFPSADFQARLLAVDPALKDLPSLLRPTTP